LISLGLDEQDEKQEKPKASKGKGSTSKISAKLKEVSLVARQTRSSKRKFEFQQEEEIKLEPKSSTSKHQFTGFDRVYT
jgi:hypothetical protein